MIIGWQDRRTPPQPPNELSDFNRATFKHISDKRRIYYCRERVPTCQGISFSWTTWPLTTLSGSVRLEESRPRTPQFNWSFILRLFKTCSLLPLIRAEHGAFLNTRISRNECKNLSGRLVCLPRSSHEDWRPGWQPEEEVEGVERWQSSSRRTTVRGTLSLSNIAT